MKNQRFTFPRWTNLTLPTIAVVGATAPLYVAVLIAFGFSPQSTDVGYMPTQPIPFSHKLHAGELGVDCRYCHNTVEKTAHAAIPPTETCMNCHSQIHPQSEKLKPLFESYETGMPIECAMRWPIARANVTHSAIDELTSGIKGMTSVAPILG